ncbi:probable xyloglucan galactosyltransferase GT11 [Primulina huaijiensis]|uniref:probable xyloglucan galactosyltransferase GT11 n=1 Tax=Primulina huaijiensis TaxID=1492673 RepID=UPI003CC7228C
MRRRFSKKRDQEEKMENPISTRHRNKFWFVFFLLFVFWYFLLYKFDWSSLPGLSSVTPDQENHLQSLDSSSILRKNVSNDQDVTIPLNHSPRNIVSRNDTSGISGRDMNVSTYTETDYEIRDLEELQKELQPQLPQEGEEYDDDDRGENRRKTEPCNGRYIYIHDLPTRYNDDLINQCKLLNKWLNMCPYFGNLGLGQRLGNPQRLFLSSGWYTTHQFALEVIFHNRMKQYKCLTNDSSKAAVIFVPYYPGLDIARYLWDHYNTSVKDYDTMGLFKWLKEKPEWNRMGGRDHFLVTGRITWDFRRAVDEDSGWGNKLMLLPESQNMTMLSIESSPWNKNDFAIPYPTYFHPSNDDQVLQWQNKLRKQKKKALFCFIGGTRPSMKGSIRGEIMEQCNAAKRKCKMLECIDSKENCAKPANVMKLFQSSIFCLQPPGDSFTRRSTFDSILAGCIPVFFHPGSAYVQYLWHLPRNYEKYSVFISQEDVKNKKVSIERLLSRIPKNKVLSMREEVIKLIPNVTYADPKSRLETVEDAFDLAVKGVLRRVEGLRRDMKEGRNSSDFDEEKSWKYYTFGKTEEHEWDAFFDRTRTSFQYA